ncbi:AAA family ATPase [Mycolicibacterium sp. BiH015]|uniref:helix-turn-helix transcriptional regulator n=1 Tax=Mycolicibacterium sp. BiH015 TaxID=3018808 RepID=UPI0022E8A92D|nr:AAA family ATPase [Mycolicibacterium sp. BiH015]MDA2893318.1 AAA family ATPase [Mycolicibacterium sp. BiH015]
MSEAANIAIDDIHRLTLPIRGRAPEVAAVSGLIGALSRGAGGVLLIEGPAGTGKSRLLTEVLSVSGRHGVRVLYGEAFASQRTIPYFALLMATQRADPPIGDLEALRDLGGSGELGYWVVHHLREAIRTAASETPLAILLEDIHLADESTLLALRSLVPELLDLPVLWVVTARTGMAGPPVLDTLSVLSHHGATRMTLKALVPEALTDVIQDALCARADDSLLRMASRAAGNPFLALELVAGLREESRLEFDHGRAAVVGDELPQRLITCVRRRLDRLPNGASALVRVASVLPDRFSAAVLAAMLDRQPVSLMSDLAEALNAGLLVDDGEHLRFEHELLRDATRDSMPQSLRRAIERQSASVLLGMGTAPAEVAAGLARSALPGDVEAIDTLRRAAQEFAHTDVDRAADFSKRALQLCLSDSSEHGRILAETVALLNRARRYGEAEELAVAALERVSVDQEAEIRLQFAMIARHGSQRRIHESRRALELGDINAVTRARHLAVLAYNIMLDRGHRHCRSAAAEATMAAEAVDDSDAQAIAGMISACLDFADGRSEAAREKLRAISIAGRPGDDTSAHLLSSVHYCNLLATVGRVGEAADFAAARIAGAEVAHDDMARDAWAGCAALVSLAAGQVDAALVAARKVPPPSHVDLTESDMVLQAVLADVAVRTGDRHLLQTSLLAAQRVGSEHSVTTRRSAHHILAMAAWHHGDARGAADWLGRDLETLAALMTPHSLDEVVLAGRVAAETGDAAVWERVVQMVATLRAEPSVSIFGALADYAEALLSSDPSRLISASARLATSERPLLHAAACQDAGAKLMALNRAAEARVHLDSAFDTFSKAGALADARRVGRTLRTLGVERRAISYTRAKVGWDSLTDSELKVINLVAQGASNRVVATRLQLSVHTVKTHVHNAFTKLGITSRAQLAALPRTC